MLPSKILLQVTGSIAAFKAAALASTLVKRGCEVQVVTTASALKFIGEASFEGITARPVHSEIFQPGKMMDHIHLTRWAELMLLYPASAHSLNRLSAGLADDLVSALALARPKTLPYFIAPAMNPEMWNHPATQDSLKKLKSWGIQILDPDDGRTACGENGPGRLMEPEEVLSRLALFFRSHKPLLKAQNILITAGGTREAIDRVRFITNMSSGKTAAVVANEILKAGGHVTYFCGQGALKPSAHPNLQVFQFEDFQDLNASLKTELGARFYSSIIHAAAVSDFSIESLEGLQNRSEAKIDSENGLSIKLKKNFKILSRLRDYSKNPDIKVIGFKLTVDSDENDIQSKIDRMWRESCPDWVVQNDLSQITPERHPGRIYQDQTPVKAFSTKQELAEQLVGLLSAQSSDTQNLNSTFSEVNV